EDSILVQLVSQARETLAHLKTDGFVGDDVVLQVATGNGWDEALDDAEWQDDDLLAIGISPTGGIARGSWGRAAQRYCGTAPCRCWFYPASTSWCRGRRRSDCPKSTPTRHRPTKPRRPKPPRPS